MTEYLVKSQILHLSAKAEKKRRTLSHSHTSDGVFEGHKRYRSGREVPTHREVTAAAKSILPGETISRDSRRFQRIAHKRSTTAAM
jgi:hypothetical protein